MTKKHSVRLGNMRLNLPGSRILRVCIGAVLILGGCLGFLPVLGFWMVPLGLVVLSIDFAIARRWRRRLETWWGNRQGGRVAKKAARRRKEK
jgi:purine-cytosine permease-like protein